MARRSFSSTSLRTFGAGLIWEARDLPSQQPAASLPQKIASPPVARDAAGTQGATAAPTVVADPDVKPSARGRQAREQRKASKASARVRKGGGGAAPPSQNPKPTPQGQQRQRQQPAGAAHNAFIGETRRERLMRTGGAGGGAGGDSKIPPLLADMEAGSQAAHNAALDQQREELKSKGTFRHVSSRTRK